jgi:outer membrane murein-binding lipoprotein Lpp
MAACITSVVTTGPAYLAARRSRGAAREEGEQTRDAISEAIGSLNGRMDDLRQDIAEVRDWQAAHTTDHAIAAIRQTDPHPGRRRMEFRREQE